MSNETSIIKIDTGNIKVGTGNVSKSATALIEKISDAIGMVYGPIHRTREAKAKAEVKKIEMLAELEQSVIAWKIQEAIKERENIKAITDQSANRLTEQAKPEEMDNDWIKYFFDKCRLVSDKEMQGLWSNILSGEANAPGTYSKRTLNLVSSLDKKDANLFTVLCNFAILYENNHLLPLILNIDDEIYSKAGLTFGHLTHLESIGLIKFNHTIDFAILKRPKVQICNYYGTKFKFTLRKDSDNKLDIGQVILTESGEQLAPIGGSKMNSEFIEYAMKYYNNKDHGSDVIKMTIVE